jgi:hypothetical protein
MSTSIWSCEKHYHCRRHHHHHQDQDISSLASRRKLGASLHDGFHVRLEVLRSTKKRVTMVAWGSGFLHLALVIVLDPVGLEFVVLEHLASSTGCQTVGKRLLWAGIGDVWEPDLALPPLLSPLVQSGSLAGDTGSFVRHNILQTMLARVSVSSGWAPTAIRGGIIVVDLKSGIRGCSDRVWSWRDNLAAPSLEELPESVDNLLVGNMNRVDKCFDLYNVLVEVWFELKIRKGPLDFARLSFP